jgi:ATP-dependent DNA helicase PIF1
METDEEDLELELLITVGARVMLTSNIWTDAGLINGALGVVEQIVYNPGILPP